MHFQPVSVGIDLFVMHFQSILYIN